MCPLKPGLVCLPQKLAPEKLPTVGREESKFYSEGPYGIRSESPFAIRRAIV